MRKWFMILLVLAAVAGTAARADTLKEDDQELSANFSYDSFDPGGGLDSINTLDLQGRYGYLFTNSQEFGALADLVRTDEGGNSTTDWGLGVFYNWNFKGGQMINPFAGAKFQYLNMDSNAYDYRYGLEGGMKIWPWANGGINVKVFYDWLHQDEAVDSATDFGVSAGINLKW